MRSSSDGRRRERKREEEEKREKKRLGKIYSGKVLGSREAREEIGSRRDEFGRERTLLDKVQSVKGFFSVEPMLHNGFSRVQLTI